MLASVSGTGYAILELFNVIHHMRIVTYPVADADRCVRVELLVLSGLTPYAITVYF